MLVIDETGSWDSESIPDSLSNLRAIYPQHGDAVLVAPTTQMVVSSLIQLDGWSRNVIFLPKGVDLPVIPSSASGIDSRTKWCLFTSGTTGSPKLISHHLETLKSLISTSSATSSFVWGLLYEPIRMAGIQVLVQAISTNTKVVVPTINWSMASKVQFMKEQGVTALSATPTIWRQILQTNESVDWALEQVSLGGEIADQKILDALQSRFPKARVAHIFASTETSAAFSVTDGVEGFPVSYLDASPKGIKLAVIDDVLHVFLPTSDLATSDGYVSTGDLVEIVNDRVLFRGRASGVINVGGAKVFPENVETVLRRHEFVIDAVVRGKQNPFSGEVVIAEVQLQENAPADAIKTLKKWAKEHLESYAVPVTIKSVTTLTHNSNGKSLRT